MSVHGVATAACRYDRKKVSFYSLLPGERWDGADDRDEDWESQELDLDELEAEDEADPWWDDDLADDADVAEDDLPYDADEDDDD